MESNNSSTSQSPVITPTQLNSTESEHLTPDDQPGNTMVTSQILPTSDHGIVSINAFSLSEHIVSSQIILNQSECTQKSGDLVAQVTQFSPSEHAVSTEIIRNDSEDIPKVYDQATISTSGLSQSEHTVSFEYISDQSEEITQTSDQLILSVNNFSQLEHSTLDDSISNQTEEEHSFWVYMINQLIGVNTNLGLSEKELTPKLYKLRNQMVIGFLIINCLLILSVAFYTEFSSSNTIVNTYLMIGLFGLFGCILGFDMVGMTINKFKIYLQKNE